jgi:tRNA-splicing ligase RtcB
LKTTFEDIARKHPSITGGRTLEHLGTLGTGNHFIEVSLDEANSVWIMLHSGSRGIGNKIGTYFIELAKKDMKKRMDFLAI